MVILASMQTCKDHSTVVSPTQNWALYNAKASIMKALAHPTRLWIVETLASEERCVCELLEGLEVDVSTLSKHLSVLKQAGIVADRKEGRWVYYRLCTPCALEFVSCLETILRNRLESDRALIEA